MLAKTVYVCVCVCERERERERRGVEEGDRDMQRQRQREGKRDRQTEQQTETEQCLNLTIFQSSHTTGICVGQPRDNSLVVCWMTKIFLFIGDIF